jgi:acetylornithine deacetylase
VPNPLDPAVRLDPAAPLNPAARFDPAARLDPALRLDPAAWLDHTALRKLDEAIDDFAEDSFAFLERLVGAPSTVGREAPAQLIVQAELARLGFETSAMAIPDDIGQDLVAGIPQAPYQGRDNMIGTLVSGDGPSLILNGHVDVVRPKRNSGRRRRSPPSAGTAGCSAGAPAT